MQASRTLRRASGRALGWPLRALLLASWAGLASMAAVPLLCCAQPRPEPVALRPTGAPQPIRLEALLPPLQRTDVWLEHGSLRSAEGIKFAPNPSREIWDQVKPAVRLCSQQLFSAQMNAIRRHASDPKRTAKSCHIDPTRAWIRDRLDHFGLSLDAGRPDQALAALGEAIAASQAFFAHTNFVELRAEQVAWEAAAVPLRLWESGALPVPHDRLLSHFLVGAANACRDGVQPRISKASPTSQPGRTPLVRWGRTAHEAALELAVIETRALLREATDRRPHLADHCAGELLWAGLFSSLE